MYRIRQFLPKICSLLLACMALLVSIPSSAEPTSLQTIKERGTLRVGLSTFVPWAMRDKQGELIGYEVDVATRLAEDAGLKVAFIPTAWDGIIPALLAGKFDVIIGGMTITPQRNLSVLFSRTYAHSGSQMTASLDQAEGKLAIEDYNKRSVTLAVRRGTTPSQAAKKYFPKARLLQFDDESQAFQEVLNGNALAAVVSHTSAGHMTARYPDKLFIPFDKMLSRGSEAFAVRQGEHDILNFFNNWIMLVEDEGWLEERHHYWFNTLEWESLLADH